MIHNSKWIWYNLIVLWFIVNVNDMSLSQWMELHSNNKPAKLNHCISCFLSITEKIAPEKLSNHCSITHFTLNASAFNWTHTTNEHKVWRLLMQYKDFMQCWRYMSLTWLLVLVVLQEMKSWKYLRKYCCLVSELLDKLFLTAEILHRSCFGSVVAYESRPMNWSGWVLD